MPAEPWRIGQTWEDLLFAHWRVPAGLLEPRLPAGLRLDRFDGDAWIGVTPFRVTNLRLRGTVPLPRLSSFLELNVRTYVTAKGRPGIWFFSLDATSALAVEAARRLYSLPYFRARIEATRRGPAIELECARADEPGRAFSARYEPAGPAAEPEQGSLESFLTERYCLYAVDRRNRLCRAEIHHAPWQLEAADVAIELNTMPPVALSDAPPLCHLARRQDVVIWPLSPLDR